MTETPELNDVDNADRQSCQVKEFVYEMENKA